MLARCLLGRGPAQRSHLGSTCVLQGQSSGQSQVPACQEVSGPGVQGERGMPGCCSLLGLLGTQNLPGGGTFSPARCFHQGNRSLAPLLLKCLYVFAVELSVCRKLLSKTQARKPWMSACFWGALWGHVGGSSLQAAQLVASRGQPALTAVSPPPPQQHDLGQRACPY